MTHALILWPYTHLAHAELSARRITFETTKNPRIVITQTPVDITFLGTISKAWDLIHKDELLTQEYKIVATNKNTWVFLKKNGITKRFKESDPTKSDLAIKKNGVEIRPLADEKDTYVIIDQRQDIQLRSDIEFAKPDTSMKIWMMPAKLTASMISLSWATKWSTIYDPFIGLWTTAFVANTQGINCLWSDLAITSAKRNTKRRQEQSHATDAKISLRKHDMTTTQKNQLAHKTQAIVTEWRLGPIVNQRTPLAEIHKNKELVTQLWTKTLGQITDFYGEKIPVIIATLPRYTRLWSGVSDMLQDTIAQYGLTMTIVDTYARPRQQVQRQIVIIKQ